VNGSLRTIRESQEGREVDFAATLALVRKALESEERTVDVPASITRPAVTAEQRDQLGIREQIARGETRFAGSSPPKIHNIKLAASRINGVVVPPGAMFSFNQELGPTTLDSGYQVGWGIASTGDGSHATVPSVAGGICQVATTLFQPVFWGGYQLEERHHHLYWIPAYGLAPLGRVGLDATVDDDAGLDFRFLNSSSDYLLIQATTDDTTLSISLYGNKPSWDVKVEGPRITNVKSARTELVRYPEPTLPWGQQIQVEGAGDGFDVQIVRTVTETGHPPRTLTLKTHYEPSQNTIAVGVKDAPPGMAEKIRSASAVARANQAARDTASSAPAPSSPAPAVAPTPVTPAVAGSAPSGAATDTHATSAAAAPTAAPAPAAAVPAARTAPAAASTSESARSAAAPARPTAAPAPAQANPAPSVPRFSSSSAPAPAARTAGGTAAQ